MACPFVYAILNNLYIIVHSVYCYTIKSQSRLKLFFCWQEFMLRDQQGRRKYLTPQERAAFMEAAKSLKPKERTFCLLIANTGCRISEALALTVGAIDVSERVVVFRCLKKRRSDVFRSVPISTELLRDLVNVHCVSDGKSTERLWPWSRGTGWARIKHAMWLADISGKFATPKGLRHGFGIAATQRGVPLNIIQKWLGHSNIETTAIYADAIGEEERNLAAKLWKSNVKE